MYEGRCYPKPEEGSLQNIHELPDDLLVDPYWSNKVLNPSRCAIMCSDQWGTVSQAYRQDLLSSSPLACLLGKHQKVIQQATNYGHTLLSAVEDVEAFRRETTGTKI